MKENYDYVEFTYVDKASFESFKALFAKMQEYKNLSSGSDKDYQEVAWEGYLTQRAKEWFSQSFDFQSEEGKVYLKLWELTPPAIRTRSLKLIPPGHWDFDATISTIFNCEYDLVALQEEEPFKAVLYLDFWAYPFGGMESMWELLRAFGFEITFDSYLEDTPPQTVSEWDYDLAKELVKQNKGVKE